MEYHRYININTLMSFLSEYLLLIYFFFIINYIFLKRRRYKIDTADRHNRQSSEEKYYIGGYFLLPRILLLDRLMRNLYIIQFLTLFDHVYQKSNTKGHS